MKQFLTVLALTLLCTGTAIAAGKVESPPSCQQCGMDRDFFAHSRMLIVYADGSSAGECSLTARLSK